jgi:hypothetical protein
MRDCGVFMITMIPASVKLFSRAREKTLDRHEERPKLIFGSPVRLP